MAVFVNTFFEKRVDRIFDLAERVEEAFSSAGLEYRVVGGLAIYLYVEEREPDAGRLTRDIDIAVRREDLRRIAEAVEPFGLQYRHVAGVDMLTPSGEPSARRAVHLLHGRESAPGTPGGRAPIGTLSKNSAAPDRSAGGFDPHEAHQLPRQGRSALERPGRRGPDGA